MLAPQERYAFILLLSVAISLTLAAFVLESTGKASFAVPFSKDSSPDGTLVSYEGVVEKVSITREGGHSIARIGGVSVFIPGSAGLSPPLRTGETVTLLGTTATYRGEREIVISNQADIIRS